ncbi:hypothetical protein SAMN06265173_11452 [Thalassovita litoralis]|jgi:hypothetical protein|uniref:Uncharacterized protein n=1 Tax=Thalassovita litoralis TaxID=1010611 RepID=A0A521E419_9RHOB|nr:hypothetical protein [Thalassovita litoralis]SMO78605.1 hypothetical protein SAMN06265173_11452 [Thalassovita litoralis]
MISNPLDPKGLIRESFLIEGISESECRSIFLDWALSLPVGTDSQQALADLHAKYAASYPDHPMTEVMAQGLQQITVPRRRGGWRSRTRN